MYGRASTSTCARSFASTVTPLPPSCRVLGVDADVFGRQVAAPRLCAAGAQAERGHDLDLGLLERAPHRLEVNLHPGSRREYGQPGDAHGQAVDGNLRAAVAKGAHDTAPVRVGA